MTTAPPKWISATNRPPNKDLLIRYMTEDGKPALCFAFPFFGLRDPWQSAFVKCQSLGRDALSKRELRHLMEADLDSVEHTRVIRWVVELGEWRSRYIAPGAVTHWMEAG